MNTPWLPPVALQALEQAELTISKIGGDNAREFQANARRIHATKKSGRKRILTISALRSSLDQDTEYSHPDVSDRSADGRLKPGFNTTSHLIAIARALQQNNVSGALALCTRIEQFLHSTIDRELGQANAVAALKRIASRQLTDTQSPLSLVSLIRSTKKVECYGEDWHIIQSDERRHSITGFGEMLAEQLYCEYLQLQGLRVAALDRSTPHMAQLHQEALNADRNIDRLRTEISHQINHLLASNDVVISGGYFPGIGQKRGYGDMAGALLAQAARQSGIAKVAYSIEKQAPICSADPRVFTGATQVSHLNYGAALELCGTTFGANGGAVHPGAIDLCAQQEIPMVIGNPDAPDHSTLVHRAVPSEGAPQVIAIKKPAMVLTVEFTGMSEGTGHIACISDVLDTWGISVDQIATSDRTITFTLAQKLSEEQQRLLHQRIDRWFGHTYPIRIHTRQDSSLIFCIGSQLDRSRTLLQIATALRAAKIEHQLIDKGDNPHVYSVMIADKDRDRAAAAIHAICIDMPLKRFEQLEAQFLGQFRLLLENE